MSVNSKTLARHFLKFDMRAKPSKSTSSCMRLFVDVRFRRTKLMMLIVRLMVPVVRIVGKGSVHIAHKKDEAFPYRVL